MWVSRKKPGVVWTSRKDPETWAKMKDPEVWVSKEDPVVMWVSRKNLVWCGLVGRPRKGNGLAGKTLRCVDQLERPRELWTGKKDHV